MVIECLIIDREPDFRQELGQFITSFRDDFHVQTVAGADKAIEAIAATDFSLILCEHPFLLKPGLVSCITERKPGVPLLIIGREDSSYFAEMNTPGFVKGFVARSARPADLAGKVVFALENIFYQGNVSGVNCCTFIQLLEQNCSDCMLRVIHSEENSDGLLFFEKGSLIDAMCGNSEAMEAVQQILSWQSTKLELYNICPLKKNRINTTTAILILKHSKKQDVGECSNSLTEMKISPKGSKKSSRGLAGLFLGKATGKK